MDNLRLSIVTVVKDDKERFLKTLESIQSLLSQSSLIEWIIVDSSYPPLDTSLKFSHDFPLISYHHISPSGIYAAMNYGITHANARYISFLNAGDVMLPSIVDILHKNASLCNVNVFAPVDFFGPFAILTPIADVKMRHVFPHQSIIYDKNIHSHYGYYSSFIDADQHFFSKVSIDEISYYAENYSARGLYSNDATYKYWFSRYKFPRLLASLIHPLYIFFRAIKHNQRISLLSLI